MCQRIIDNLFFIQRGWLNANHFLYKGKKKILIDTAYISDYPQTLNKISNLGVLPSQVDLIISTHSHCDHIGGNKYIQEASGCSIAMHGIDRHFIHSRDDWATWWRYYDQQAAFFQVDISLQEGDSVFLDELELKVLHTPGHAAGMIALYSPQAKILFSSDACWDGDLGALTPRIEGSAAPLQALYSLEKLEQLDIQTIYPGHGPPIHDPWQALQRCRKKLLSFLDAPEKMARDQLKKLFIYVLLMKKGIETDQFLPYLQRTFWFPETVDLFLEGKYRQAYEQTLDSLTHKGLVYIQDNKYYSAISP